MEQYRLQAKSLTEEQLRNEIREIRSLRYRGKSKEEVKETNTDSAVNKVLKNFSAEEKAELVALLRGETNG